MKVIYTYWLAVREPQKYNLYVWNIQPNIQPSMHSLIYSTMQSSIQSTIQSTMRPLSSLTYGPPCSQMQSTIQCKIHSCHYAFQPFLNSVLLKTFRRSTSSTDWTWVWFSAPAYIVHHTAGMQCSIILCLSGGQVVDATSCHSFIFVLASLEILYNIMTYYYNHYWVNENKLSFFYYPFYFPSIVSIW